MLTGQRTLFFFIFTFLTMVLLTACTPSGEPVEQSRPVSDAESLQNSEWWLAEVGGEAVEATVTEPPLNLRFFVDEYNEYSAFTGCNYQGGRFYLDQEPVFDEQGITDFDCVPVRQEQEASILSGLEAARGLQVNPEGQLEIVNAAGEVLLVYDPKPVPDVDPALADTEWELISLKGQPPSAEVPLTLSIESQQLGGFAGCNHYGGEIRTLSDGTFQVAEIASTAMACEWLDSEQTFQEALRAVTAYRLQGEQLELLNEEGAVVLTFQRKAETVSDPDALSGSEWQLVTVDGEPLSARRPVTLLFHDARRFSGQSECRNYTGSYQADEDNIQFPSVAMMGEPCEGEQLYLPPSGDYLLEPERLTFIGTQGETLVYEPPPDSEDLALEGTEWHLIFFSPPEGTPADWDVLPFQAVTLELTDNWLRAYGGCNYLEGSYTLAERNLSFPDGLESTLMACEGPGELVEQEERYYNILRSVTRYQITGELLWLAGEGEQGLLFEAAQ